MQTNKSTPRFYPTFSVKIEFLLACLPHGTKDPHEHDPRQVYGILPAGSSWSVQERGTSKKASECLAETLNGANIPACCKPDPKSSSQSSDGPEMQDWTLADKMTAQSSIQGSNLPYEFATIEIAWPVLYFTPEGISQVQAVFEVLTNNYRIICSERGGLHVYIGNERNQFQGRAVQKILAALWTFEPILETMHPRHRAQSRFCRGLRRDSNLLKEFEKPGMTWMKLLEELLGLSGSLSNAALLSKVIRLSDNEEGPGAYNFRNLTPRDTKKMIEFRMHESTLNGPAVENWIKVCIGLVNLERVDMRILAPFLAQNIDDVLDVPKFLKSLGLPPQVLYYSTKSHTTTAAMEVTNEDEMKIATPSEPNIKATAMDGCSAWFIWTSNPEQLICVHSLPELDEYDKLIGRSVKETEGAVIKAITIIVAEDENVNSVEILKTKFNSKFPKIEPTFHSYLSSDQIDDLWQHDVDQGVTDGEENPRDIEWDMEATIETPGEVVRRYTWTWYRGRKNQSSRSAIWDL